MINVDYKSSKKECCPEHCGEFFVTAVAVTLVALSIIATLTLSIMLVANFVPIGDLSPLTHALGLPWLCVALGFSITCLILSIYLATRSLPKKEHAVILRPSKKETPSADPEKKVIPPLPLSTPKEEIAQPKIPLSSQVKTAQPEPTLPPPQLSPEPTQPAPPAINKVAETEQTNSQAQLRSHISTRLPNGIYITIPLVAGKKVKEVYAETCKQHGLHGFKLMFSGVALDMEKDGEKDAYAWAQKLDLVKLTTVHIIFDQIDPARKIQSNQEMGRIWASFRFWDRDGRGGVFCPELPTTSSLNNLCHVLEEERHYDPGLTLIRIICCGVELTVPENLSRNIFEIQKEHEFQKLACLHALTVAISKEDGQILSDLLEHYKFPGFTKARTVEFTMQGLRTTLWSSCDRLFRRREGAGSPDLEKQIHILQELLKHEKTTQAMHGYLSGLIKMVSSAYNIYAATAASSYDELVKLLKKELLQESTQGQIDPSTAEEKQIEFEIDKKTYTIGKRRLLHLSSYLAAMVERWQGQFKDTKEEIDAFELQEQSVHLFDYLGGTLQIQTLSDQEVGALLNTAESLIFNELSYLCQCELIQRLRNAKKVNAGLEKLLQRTAILQKAYCIWMGQQFWKSTDVEKQIAKIKKDLIVIPPPKIDEVKDDCEMELKMPSETAKILKSQLMRSVNFASRLERWQKENKVFAIEYDLPEEILDYLVTGSDAYKTLSWERIQEVYPVADFYDLREMAFYLKNRVCDELLKSYNEKREKTFCDILVYLRKELELWGMEFTATRSWTTFFK